MTAAATVRTGSKPSSLWALYRIVQRHVVLVAAFALALTLSSGAWSGSLCRFDAQCAGSLSDAPVAIGSNVAVVEWVEEFAADNFVDMSDGDPHKPAVAVNSIRFIDHAVGFAATARDRQRTLFPEKTGPPRV